MASLEQKELLITKSLLKKVVDASREMESLSGDNPQVVEIRKRAKAERQLAEAVLNALGGDLVQLRLYSEGR